MTPPINAATPHDVSYGASSPWSPLAAIAATVFALVTGLAASAAVLALALQRGLRPLVGTTLSLLGFQIVVTLLMIALAGAFGGRRLEVLGLARGWPGLTAIAKAVAGMVAILAPFNVLVFMFARETIVADLKPFQDLVQSPAAPLVLVALALGAPLSEELSFRGFLMSSLAPSRLGFAASALLTTAAWTLLHFSYSIIGLLEVFLVGLYFCWLLWTTGNLWLPLICHGIYNGAIFFLLRAFPLS